MKKLRNGEIAYPAYTPLQTKPIISDQDDSKSGSEIKVASRTKKVLFPQETKRNYDLVLIVTRNGFIAFYDS